MPDSSEATSNSYNIENCLERASEGHIGYSQTYGQKNSNVLDRQVVARYQAVAVSQIWLDGGYSFYLD